MAVSRSLDLGATKLITFYMDEVSVVCHSSMKLSSAFSCHLLLACGQPALTEEIPCNCIIHHTIKHMATITQPPHVTKTGKNTSI